jgi:hypothetical protein
MVFECCTTITHTRHIETQPIPEEIRYAIMILHTRHVEFTLRHPIFSSGSWSTEDVLIVEGGVFAKEM